MVRNGLVLSKAETSQVQRGYLKWVAEVTRVHQ